ncbi:MAG: DNA-3-methyladenine glycosylase 2 family protein [Pseudomonadota bacterium]
MSQRSTIETRTDIALGLEALRMSDPRMAQMIARAGNIPLRRSEPGFGGLARTIIAQQVSKASADAISKRFFDEITPANPTSYIEAGEGAWRRIGLSRPKQRTLTAVCAACEAGAINLDTIASEDAETAIARLTEIKGIGPWTAEIYLMFCGGHPDIFPAGDLALQIAAHEALDLNARPKPRELSAIAESWRPWRSVAARVLWAWYGVTRSREVMP